MAKKALNALFVGLVLVLLLAVNNLLHLALAGVCIVIIISSKYNPFICFRF